jgi:hypothetical protein
MSRLTLATLLALLATSAMAAEQYYKWKDDNGVWNYSTVPPKDKATTTVNIATGATSAAAAAAGTEPQEGGSAPEPGGAPKPPAAGQPSEERSLAATADAMSRIKETQSANCERARGNVATLENNPRVQIGDKALSDDEQMQELVKARRQVEVFCNSR